MEAEEEKQQTTLDIYPIGKIKRALVFLADYFISFIICLAIFSFAVFPLTKTIVGYDQKDQLDLQREDEMLDILYSKNLLFYSEGEEHELTLNLETTSKSFLSYHVKNSSLTGNCFWTFYQLDGRSASDLSSSYHQIDSADNCGFFQETDNNDNLPKLKDLYVEEFAPAFNEQDEMTEKGKSDYARFNQYFFLTFYSQMLTEIENMPSDSSTGLGNYGVFKREISDNKAFLRKATAIAAYIAYAFTWLGCFLLVPLFSKRRKTLAMMIMKIERVDKRDFSFLNRKVAMISSLYDILFNLSFLFFVPAGYVAFSYLFSLPTLGIISLVGIICSLISYAFLLFSKYNQTGRDSLTWTVYLTEEDVSSIGKVRNKYE